MVASKDWGRLAEFVRERRTDLGMTQEDARGVGGPSTATMRLIEGALQQSYQPSTLRDLEKALRWERGSVRSILAGGNPVPAPDALGLAPPAAPEPVTPDPGDDVTGAVVAALFGPKERKIWAHIRHKLASTPAGRALFADPAEVTLWPPEAPDGFSGGAPFDLTAEARQLLDAIPAAELFTDPNEVTVWRLDRLPYRKRISMIREYREPVRGAGTVRRAGLRKPDGLTA